MNPEVRQVQKAEFEKGLNGAGLVGPFSVIDETRLKIISLFFRPVVIGLPWYQDVPAAYRFEGAGEPIRFISPPEELKPGPDFIKQVENFKQAPPQSRDTESHAYLKTAQSREKQEESGRDIERELRGLNAAVSAESPNRGRLWNLTLHLAHAIETRAAEADRMLAQIRTRSSPLTVLQEAEEAPGFFIDLPPRETGFLFNEQQMEQICAAWCGLFESHLAEYPVLITDRRPVWDFLSAVWDPSGRTEPVVETTLEFFIPDPVNHSFASLVELRKTYFKPQHLQAFQKALNTFVDRPREAQTELIQVGREIAGALPAKLKAKRLRLRVMTLDSFPDSARFRDRSWIPALFNKVLIFMDRDG